MKLDKDKLIEKIEDEISFLLSHKRNFDKNSKEIVELLDLINKCPELKYEGKSITEIELSNLKDIFYDLPDEIVQKYFTDDEWFEINELFIQTDNINYDKDQDLGIEMFDKYCNILELFIEYIGGEKDNSQILIKYLESDIAESSTIINVMIDKIVLLYNLLLSDIKNYSNLKNSPKKDTDSIIKVANDLNERNKESNIISGIDNSDYLVKSGTFDQELDEDTLEWHDGLLNDDDVDEFTKQLILKILKPFKISMLKFKLNLEYFNEPYHSDLRNDHSYIAPSLKTIKKNWYSHFAAGYPNWFYVAFPDVSIWAIRGKGKELIKKKFRKLKESDFIENNHIKIKYLIKIIEYYRRETMNTLECAIY